MQSIFFKSLNFSRSTATNLPSPRPLSVPIGARIEPLRSPQPTFSTIGVRKRLLHSPRPSFSTFGVRKRLLHSPDPRFPAVGVRNGAFRSRRPFGNVICGSRAARGYGHSDRPLWGFPRPGLGAPSTAPAGLAGRKPPSATLGQPHRSHRRPTTVSDSVILDRHALDRRAFGPRSGVQAGDNRLHYPPYPPISQLSPAGRLRPIRRCNGRNCQSSI